MVRLVLRPLSNPPLLLCCVFFLSRSVFEQPLAVFTRASKSHTDLGDWCTPIAVFFTTALDAAALSVYANSSVLKCPTSGMHFSASPISPLTVSLWVVLLVKWSHDSWDKILPEEMATHWALSECLLQWTQGLSVSGRSGR